MTHLREIISVMQKMKLVPRVPVPAEALLDLDQIDVRALKRLLDEANAAYPELYALAQPALRVAEEVSEYKASAQ